MICRINELKISGITERCAHLLNTLKEDLVNDLICYCFGYSADDIEKDYRDNGVSTIIDRKSVV